MSRARRSTWNYLCTVGLSVVTLVLGLFATPLLVKWLGKERLGAFRVISDWGGYLTLLEIALGGALAPMMASAINRDDPNSLADAMATGFHGYRRIAALSLIGGALLVLFIPFLVPASPQLRGDLRLAMCLIAIGAGFLPLSPLRILWDANQRGYVLTLIVLAQSLVITGTSLFFAHAGWGISGQAMGVLLGLAVNFGILYALTTRHFHEVPRWLRTSASKESRAALWSLNWATMAMAITGRLSFLTDNIVIGYFLGPETVVPFFLTQRLPQLAQNQLQAVGNSTWAGMVHLLHTDGPSAFNHRLTEMTQLVIICGLAVTVPIMAFNSAFVQIWMPNQGMYAGLLLTVLACVSTVLQAVFSFWGWMFSGTGRVAQLVPLHVVSAVVNLGLSVGVTVAVRSTHPILSVTGPVMGTVIAMLTCQLWWYPLLLRRSFGTSLMGLLIACIRPVFAAVPIGMLAAYIAHVHPPKHWLSLAVEMSIAAFLYLFLAWLISLNGEQRQAWKERVTRDIPFLRNWRIREQSSSL